MADDLRAQIELAILGRTATRAADAVMAVVEPAIRQAQAQALRDAAREDWKAMPFAELSFSGSLVAVNLEARADGIATDGT